MLHLVGGARCGSHLADAAIAWLSGIAGGAQVVEDILGGDGLLADTAFGEGHVSGIAASR